MINSDLSLQLCNAYSYPDSGPITTLAFTKNNCRKTLLSVATSDRFISIYGLEGSSLKKKFSYKYHLQGINRLKFCPSSTLLVSGGNDLTVNIFDIERQCLFRSFTTESVVTSLDINYASNLLIIGTYENYVSLYDIRTRNIIVKMIAHSEPITSVVFSEDSSVFITTSYDSFCRIWDVFRFSCLKTYVLENSPPLNSCCLMPNEDYIMLNAFEGRNEIVNISNEEEVKKYTGNKHQSYLIDCSIYNSSNGSYHIICGDEDGYLCSWNILSTSQCKKHPINTSCVINSMDYSQGVIACAGLNDNTNSVYLLKEIGSMEIEME